MWHEISWCFEDALTWGTRACARRCPGVSSCWRPRCGWCRRWLVPALWSSTKLSDAQTSPSLPLNPPARAPRSLCTPVDIHKAQYTNAVDLFLHIPGWHSIADSYLLYVLCYETSTHFLVVGDEEEGLGLRGTLGLHLLEAEVIVHHLPDLLNLRKTQFMCSEEIKC